jgi:putative ABC transport system substrate-binding protein
MRRRELLFSLGGAMMTARALRAQQKAMPVIGFLSSQSRQFDDTLGVLVAFRQGLNEAGYVEGRNVAIEYRWGEGNYDRLPVLAAELVRREVTAIVAGGTPAEWLPKLRPQQSLSSSISGSTQSSSVSSRASTGPAEMRQA